MKIPQVGQFLVFLQRVLRAEKKVLAFTLTRQVADVSGPHTDSYGPFLSLLSKQYKLCALHRKEILMNLANLNKILKRLVFEI